MSELIIFLLGLLVTALTLTAVLLVGISEGRDPKLNRSTSYTLERDGTMKTLDIIAAVLLVVGGLNWGLWGAFEFDLVAAIGGGQTAVFSKLIYCVVGLAAIYQAASLKAIQRRWNVRPAMA